jgi:hypothetical protein
MDFKNKSNELNKDLPANEVLECLTSSINEYYIYLPLLVGFN